MRLNSSLITAFAVALGAAAGFGVATAESQKTQVHSATSASAVAVRQEKAGETSDAHPRRTDSATVVAGLSPADQLAVASHNQLVAASLAQSGKKPNICIIWGDDIGQSNISAYTMGMMGYHTPNIDRIAKEGMLFT
ncbi:MAG TPA: arylsulfatase, partial [Schlesneria sp.]